ncbi:MAG: hypothetical protein FWD69_06650 [Polyangiaceae bacterium]|nr:hypothetical protein [Polyangiaceae bacterium]
MQFADPRESATAYLVLRQLYDGDVIDWPIADDHPLRPIFVTLESQGFVARWDRMWPLSDRYRLTDKGIAAIEAVYRPAGAEAFFQDLRQRNLSPADRRAYLQSRGVDPVLWPVLHDPSTHWSTYATVGSRYHAYVWEDFAPPKMKRASREKAERIQGGGGPRAIHPRHRPQHIVDLDRYGYDRHDHPSATTDYDVS